MHDLRSCYLALCVLLCACGEPKGETETTATTAGSETSAGPTTDSSTGSSSETGTGTGTESGTGTPTTTSGEACVDPSQDPTGPAVAITLRNATDVTLFVDLNSGCDPIDPFEMRDADDKVVRTVESCLPSRCDAVLEGGCGCPAGCGPGQVIQISPGGSFVAEWSGIRWVDTSVPAECAMGGCNPACIASEQTPPGMYSLTAVAADALGGCRDQCTCEPDANGSCLVFGFADTPDFQAQAQLDYPAANEVALVFEP